MKEEHYLNIYKGVCVRKLKCCTYLDNIECVMIVMSPCTTCILYARRRGDLMKKYITYE